MTDEQKKEFGKQQDQKWREYRKNVQSMPIEERSKVLKWFHLIVQSAMQKTPEETPEEVKAEAVKIQHKFFTENPFRLLTDIHLFKPLLTGSQGLDGLLGGTIKAAVLKDMQYAEREERFNSVDNKELI